MIYEDVFRKLQQAKVKYLVAGGVAINLHGILRATADLDLMVQLENGKNIAKFISVLKELKFKPRVPIAMDDFIDTNKRQTWIKEKGAMVMTFIKPNSYEQIDVFLENPIDFAKAYARRKRIFINSVTISVSSLEDLKSMKKLAGREKDLSDLKQIEKVRKIKNETA